MNELKEQIQLTAMEMISIIGSAKSTYLEALQQANQGNIQQAREMVTQGRELFSQAHGMHFDFIAQEADGKDLPFSLILMHAEDQMLSTETIQILVSELIDLYDKLNMPTST